MLVCLFPAEEQANREQMRAGDRQVFGLADSIGGALRVADFSY
jgi:hypothetical protein